MNIIWNSKLPESLEHKKARLRSMRETECFKVVDRPLWLNTLTDEEKLELKRWYEKWLNVTKTLEIPEKPDFLK